MTWRRLAELIRWLPPDSALAVSVHGAPSTWSTEAHLLAGVVDALHLQLWQQSKKGTPRPKPVPRPGGTPGQNAYGKGRGVSIAELEQRRSRKRPKGGEPLSQSN